MSYPFGAGSGMLIGMRVRVFLTGVLVVASTAACAFDERICGRDEYPVKAVGNTTGAACVPEGEEPPAGYVKYPEGKVPERVGDKWDEYWSKVIVDESGAIVSE